VVTDSIGTLYGSDSETYGGAAGVSYVGSKGFVGAGWQRYDTNYGTPGPETLSDGSSIRIDMRQDRYDLKGELQQPTAWLDNLRLRFSHGDYHHQEFEPDGTPGTIFDQNADEGRISFEHEPFAQWRGTLGLQYRYIDFNAVGDEAFVPESTTENPAFFIFEERPFGDVKLELGARIEGQTVEPEASLGLPEYDDASYSGSAGLLWKFAPAYSASINVTRSQRHPSATELYANGPHVAVGRFEVGDPTLGKETALTVDLTLRRYEGPVTFDVTLFGNRFDDYIFPFATGVVPPGEEFEQFDYRQQDAKFYGAEGEITLPLPFGDLGDLSLRLASDYVRGEFSHGGDIPQMPPWRVGAELRYGRERLEAALSTFQYADQDEVATNERPTDGYTMVGAELSYRFPLGFGGSSVFGFLKGSNLLDEEARRSTSPLKDFAPLPGRSLTAGVRMAF